MGLAAELSASSIIDIGCGTGAITCELAGLVYGITGIDPSPEMLKLARTRPGGDLVRWIEGDASSLQGSPEDLAIMTGHVAQVIIDEDVWRRTLSGIHGALRSGGHVAFESRNPAARGWLAWTPEKSFRRMEDTPFGEVEVWWRLLEVSGDMVRYEIHHRFADSGEEAVSINQLRFRSQVELAESLIDSGFTVRHVFGDWSREPVGPTGPELIYIATRD